MFVVLIDFLVRVLTLKVRYGGFGSLMAEIGH